MLLAGLIFASLLAADPAGGPSTPLGMNGAGACRLGSSEVVFATEAQARQLLTTKDGFIAAMSSFDRSSRLHSDGQITVDGFVQRIGAEAQAWSPDEQQKVTAAVCDLSQHLAAKRWKLPLPSTVLLVKSTGKEEGGVPYTRGAAIVLPSTLVASPHFASGILAHELFHVLSRQLAKSDPSRRDALYSIVGYSPLNAPFEIPASYRELKMTNPDAFEIAHGIQVKGEAGAAFAVPFLFASGPYRADQGTAFFDYLTFRLMPVEKKGAAWVVVKDSSGQPALLDPASTNYADLVGHNTEENFQPDEVLADNFTFALGYGDASSLPNPEVPKKLDAALARFQ